MKTLPYGSWPSPISAERIARSSSRMREPRWDGDTLFWLESRPTQGGRQTVMRAQPDGSQMEILDEPFNARTRVNEYGGGSYLVNDGVLYFSNFGDGRIYSQSDGQTPIPLTPENAPLRFADFCFDRFRNQLICVGEDLSDAGKEPVTFLTSVSFDSQRVVRRIAEGADFYSSPRLSPDGSQLAWLSWRHPQMPWEGTELWIATVKADGLLDAATLVAGSTRESVFQPEWGRDGSLYFISDKTGWSNLYRKAAGGRDAKAEALLPKSNDFGTPAWVFGLSTYALLAGDTLLCAPVTDGCRQLSLLDLKTKKLTALSHDGSEIQSVQASGGGGKAVFLSGSFREPTKLWIYDGRETPGTLRPITRRGSESDALAADMVSAGESIFVPGKDGQKVHAFFYRPKNSDARGASGELPPLLVVGHGGPTAAAEAGLSPSIQYWTTRGFAVADVNYRGSTGFGRRYQDLLAGQWGVSDVEDCENTARFLSDKGWVDKNRCAVRGSSAGGYTALCALTFGATFRAGASYYGISDLQALTADTHKFESRYTFSLVGNPENFVTRSPIHYVDKLNCPIIFFQGTDDKVVPPNQAQGMVEALKAKRLPVAYLEFEGEGHGFRKSANVQRALEAELYFYSRIFGFVPAEKLEPVKIENE